MLSTTILQYKDGSFGDDWDRFAQSGRGMYNLYPGRVIRFKWKKEVKRATFCGTTHSGSLVVIPSGRKRPIEIRANEVVDVTEETGPYSHIDPERTYTAYGNY